MPSHRDHIRRNLQIHLPTVDHHFPKYGWSRRNRGGSIFAFVKPTFWHKTFYCILLLLLFSSPVVAQVAAAGWCVVVTDQNQESVTDPPDDSFPPQPDEQPTQPNQLGCDIGIGFLLYQPSNPKYNRFALVAVIGSESLGPGIAYILNPNAKSEADHRPIMAIAVGVTTPYDENGIVMDPKLTLGMTLSLRQGVGDE